MAMMEVRPLADRPPRRWSVNQVLFAAVLIAAICCFPPLAPVQAWQSSFATYAIAIILESMPYILVGSLMGGLIDVLLPVALLPRMVRALGPFAIPATALISPAFPACECGVLAVARGLMRKGLPLPHTVTYLLAGPILNPTVLFTTWLAFRDWRYPVLRAVGALFVAILAGFLMTRVDARRALLPALLTPVGGPGHDPAAPGHDCCADVAGAPIPAPVQALARHALVRNPSGHGVGHADLPHLGRVRMVSVPAGTLSAPMPAMATFSISQQRPVPARAARLLGQLSAQVINHFLDMAGFFLIGVFIASAMKTFVGAEVFATMGHGAFFGPLAMMAAAFVLSLCAEADAFIAASFTEFSLPAHMSFLVFGPMFDIKLLLMYRAVFRGWFIMALAGGIAILVGIYVAVLECLL
jgi:uncharacterized membrane protein YraQ (UPF0718 family)